MQSAAQNAVNAWTTGPQPFTAAWYVEHPNAWKVTHPYAPAAAVAWTTATVAAWLTRPVVASGTTVVVAEDAENEPAESDARSAETSADATASPNSPSENSSTDADDQTVWMPLGIFTLYAPGETLPTRMIELALAQDGRIGGTHYDRLRNEIDTVSGNIDRSTMVLEWKIGEKGGVFETPLDALTQAEASITVRLPDGAVTQWRIVKRGS